VFAQFVALDLNWKPTLPPLSELRVSDDRMRSPFLEIAGGNRMARGGVDGTWFAFERLPAACHFAELVVMVTLLEIQRVTAADATRSVFPSRFIAGVR